MDHDDIDITGTVFDRMRLDNDTCFLCGVQLTRDTRTLEHVFPRWLQERHNLWDQTITLINGTPIPYRQLTIPCCSECNSSHLSSIENQVRTAFESGYERTATLPEHTLCQWIGKIFYGILRKELTLKGDRRDRTSCTIVSEIQIKRFESLHLLLQSIRQPFTFPAGPPFSTLVVNLHSSDQHDTFDFRDSFETMVVSLRSHGVGIIVILQDANVMVQSYVRYIDEVAGRKIHQIQFNELYAKCLYQMSLVRMPILITVASLHSQENTIMHSLGSATVDDWNQADYAKVLRVILQQSHPEIDSENLFVPPNFVMTWMSDDEGHLSLFNEHGQRSMD